MDINVCLPTLNRYDLVVGLIKSAEAGTLKPTRYVIVDNGGSYPGQSNARITVLRPGTNIGVAPSWNIFMQNYPGINIICNDDIEFNPNMLELMVKSIQENPGAGLFVPAHNAGNAFSCFILNPECYKALGPFDEEFAPAYFEDNDYHRRMMLAEWPTILVQDAGYLHHGSATVKAYSPDQMMQHHENFRRNQAYYIRKWGGTPGLEQFKVPFNGEGNGQV